MGFFSSSLTVLRRQPGCLIASMQFRVIKILVGVELKKGESLAYNLHAICYSFGSSKVAAEVV